MQLNLRPHQEAAVRKISQVFSSGARSFLVADDTGIGKSRVGCTIAKDYSKVLIVAPLSTMSGWLSEAKEVNLDLRQANGKWPESSHVIVNYERLSRFPDHIIKGSGKSMFPYSFDLIIWDESQKLKSYKSQRHKIWAELSRVAGKCLYLSATPAQNPLEMKYLCDVIGLHVNEYWAWVKSFRGITQPRWGGFRWLNGSQSDRQRLSGILNGAKSIRRTPEDISGWPELNRIIDPIYLSTSEMSHYKDAFREYKERLEAAGKSLNSKAQQLVAVGQFKQRISEVKLPHTLAKIKDLAEDGFVVTVSCQYIASAAWLQENLTGLRVACITGSTSSASRMDILQASKNDLLDVIIFTIAEGINLHQIEDAHRPRIQLIHDIRWSSMDMKQVEGRTHRAGRYAPVYWMTCNETIDDRIAKVLKGKMDSMENMLDADLMEVINE